MAGVGMVVGMGGGGEGMSVMGGGNGGGGLGVVGGMVVRRAKNM